ncbi:hypothetical protein NKR19_g6155 [Coniochaeta hoffmannii]|uniref:Uncharacterized protein n=1 Tax=Coniochaeta hoffmannii TaxID=91930 RepID=A0AA38VQN1_9PEZI|nr:hypothetical protein NKR19_g6155 [Coniochaeta hoffmannii]
MANVTLDSQTSFKPQHDTNYPQRGAGGASQDNALLISSDDESDYDDLSMMANATFLSRQLRSSFGLLDGNMLNLATLLVWTKVSVLHPAPVATA